MGQRHLALACTASEQLEPELGTLTQALGIHGFLVEKAESGTVGRDGHIMLPLLRIKGDEREAERLGSLLVAFYSGERPVDTTLAVDEDFDDDQTVDDHLEFELDFKGAETLVMLPPELFSEETRASILARYHRELAEFAQFLTNTPAISVAA